MAEKDDQIELNIVFQKETIFYQTDIPGHFVSETYHFNTSILGNIEKGGCAI